MSAKKFSPQWKWSPPIQLRQITTPELAEQDVLQYYRDIDANDVDAALDRFAPDAVYQRGEHKPIVGIEQLQYFFKNARILRGKHQVNAITRAGFVNHCEIFTRGVFVGTLSSPNSLVEEKVEIAFTDLWVYDQGGAVKYRESTLSKKTS